MQREKFGPVMQFQMVYFGKIQDTHECVTIELYIKSRVNLLSM